ncbi:MAG: type II secretion system protein [Sutterella sp.]|nr:type II secretion system protein [Sutterella sp.]
MRNNDRGFTLLEITTTLIIVGIIGLAVSGTLTRIVQDFVIARSVADRMPVVDSSLSVIRRALETKDHTNQVKFIKTVNGFLQMQTDGTAVNLLKGATIKDADDSSYVKEVKFSLNSPTDEAKTVLERLSLDEDIPTLEDLVSWDITVSVSPAEGLPSFEFPISVGK